MLSAILGFSAEGTKLTPDNIVQVYDKCIYPPNPALGQGICAVIFLLVAQVTISVIGGCCGCCKSRSIPSETKRIIGVVCAVFSWIAAVIAWALLIEGAAWNANGVREATLYSCPRLKDGIFASAGMLSRAATALGITSYIMMRPQEAKTAALPVPPKEEPQFPSPPPAAAAEGNNGCHSTNQDSPPQEGAVAAPHDEEQSGLPAPRPPPPQVPQPPQTYVPNPDDPPHCPQCSGRPGSSGPSPPPITPSAGNGQSEPELPTVIRTKWQSKESDWLRRWCRIPSFLDS